MNELRRAIVAEARTWEGTPWHHEARVKGVGVDCAQLLIAVFSAVGAIPAFDTEHYPPDWHLHRSEQLFLKVLKQYADPIEIPLSGDIAMFNFARADAHGAIVLEWPEIIHAYVRTGVVQRDDARRNVELADRLAGFYSLKALRANELAI